jgi:hypothetical protein
LKLFHEGRQRTKEYKSISRTYLKMSRRVRLNQELRAISNGPKSFYGFVRNQLSQRRSVAPLRDTSGVLCSDSRSKADILQRQFSSVFLPSYNRSAALPSTGTNASVPISPEVAFEPHRIQLLLKDLPDSCGPSPDGIPAALLRRCAFSLALPICGLLQKSMAESCLPLDWRSAFVHPLLKKAPSSIPSNYRPISLTSWVCKVGERCIKEVMLRHLLDHHLLSDQQYGFLPGRSTLLQLVSVSWDWCSMLNNDLSVDIFYTDLAKAFDTVPHDLLLSKLLAFNFAPTIISWIKAFLSDRTQTVLVDNACSASSDVPSGVVQGSCLGPILFLLYVNDAPNCARHPCRCVLFADDAKLYSASSYNAMFLDSCFAFQDWCATWKLRIALDKCSIMHLGRPSDSDTAGVLHVDSCDVFRDLGVYVDSRLKFTRHCSEVSKKASRLANLILRVFKCKDASILVKAFCCYVRPILEYCSPVWSPFQIKDVNMVEAVQRRFTKRVISRCLPRFNHFSYHERIRALKMDTLELRRVRADVVLFHDIVYKHRTLFDKLFAFNSNADITRGHSLRVTVPSFIPAYEFTRAHFVWRTHLIWNRLPSSVAHCVNREVFKSNLCKLPDSLVLPVSRIR